jgi:hypothetical protein
MNYWKIDDAAKKVQTWRLEKTGWAGEETALKYAEETQDEFFETVKECMEERKDDKR